MIVAAVALFGADGYLAHRFADAPADQWSTRLARCGISTVLILVLSQLAIGEFIRLTRQAGYNPLSVWPRLTAAALVALPWLTLVGLVPELGALSARLSPTSHLLTIGIAGTIVFMVLRRQTEKALSNLAISILIIAYLGYFSSFVVRLRCDFPTAAGAYWVIYYIAVTKFTDIGAFLIGRKIGKTKLIPAVSPGKSVEGFVGGIVVAVLVAILLGRFAPTWAQFSHAPSLAQVIGFGVLIAIFGQLGDLIISLLKRDIGIKDSGQVVPAFGGYLDIVDSPLLTAPVAWLLLATW